MQVNFTITEVRTNSSIWRTQFELFLFILWRTRNVLIKTVTFIVIAILVFWHISEGILTIIIHYFIQNIYGRVSIYKYTNDYIECVVCEYKLSVDYIMTWQFKSVNNEKNKNKIILWWRRIFWVTETIRVNVGFQTGITTTIRRTAVREAGNPLNHSGTIEDPWESLQHHSTMVSRGLGGSQSGLHYAEKVIFAVWVRFE